MASLQDLNFTVTIHFNNGATIEHEVNLSKAYKLSSKPNVIIPENTELIELKGINNQTIIIPMNMTFVINEAPDFKHIDKVSRYMLYRRDNGKCSYCGKAISMKEATIDHIFPKSQGGQTTWENVALACHKCNCRKDNRTPKQAGMTLLVTPYNPKRSHRQQSG